MTTWSAFCGGTQSNCVRLEDIRPDPQRAATICCRPCGRRHGSRIAAPAATRAPRNSPSSRRRACPSSPRTRRRNTHSAWHTRTSPPGSTAGRRPWASCTTESRSPTRSIAAASFGLTHKYNATDTYGTDFMVALAYGWRDSGGCCIAVNCGASNNYCVGAEEEENNDLYDYGTSPVDNAMVVTQFDPTPNAVITYLNGTKVLTKSPPKAGKLNAGTAVHLGGGGDLSQPDPVLMREALFTNNVMSASEVTAMKSNITTFFSALKFSRSGSARRRRVAGRRRGASGAPETGRRDRDLPRRARVPDGGAPAHPHAGLLPRQHLELPRHPGGALRAGARLAARAPRAQGGEDGRAPPDRDPAGARAAGPRRRVRGLLRRRERVLPGHPRLAREPVRGRGAHAGLLGHLPAVVRDLRRAPGPVLRRGRAEHRAAVLLRPRGRGVGLPARAPRADLGGAAAGHHDGALRRARAPRRHAAIAIAAGASRWAPARRGTAWSRSWRTAGACSRSTRTSCACRATCCPVTPGEGHGGGARAVERPRAHEPRARRHPQPEGGRGGVGHRAGRRDQQREGRALGSGGEASGPPARSLHHALPFLMGHDAEAHSRALRGRGARHGRARLHGPGQGGHHGRGAEPRRGRPGPGSAARGHEPARLPRAAQHAPRGARGARLPQQRPRALRPPVRGHQRLDQRRAHRPHAEVPRHLRGHGVVPRPPGPGPGLDDGVREPARAPQGREPAAALRRARPRRLREGGLRVRRPGDPGARQHGRQAGRAHAGRDRGHRAEGGVVAVPAEGALLALGRGPSRASWTPSWGVRAGRSSRTIARSCTR